MAARSDSFIVSGCAGLAVGQQARALGGGDEVSHDGTLSDVQNRRNAFPPLRESTDAQAHPSAEV